MDRPSQPETAPTPSEDEAATPESPASQEEPITPPTESAQPSEPDQPTVPALGTPLPPFVDPDRTPAYGTRIPRPPRPADPLAAAVGNASLLGIGYVLLGRKGLAVANILVTALLVGLLVSVAPTLWFEVLVVVWWVAVIAHGWVLARPRPRLQPTRTHRLVALGAALPVLLAFGLLRFDAAGIDRDVADARAAGDCERALTATSELWFGHRVADAPMDERADDTVQACDRLGTAAKKLDTALAGDTGALAAGFDGLAGVLADLPGHEPMVASTVDEFVGELPVADPCRTMAITDWLREKNPRGNVFRPSADVVPEIAPTAIVDCADTFMAKSDWQTARQRYQHLLDEYPDHDLAPEAQNGVVKATQAIELANVRSLLTTSGDVQPAYCTSPAPYSGAKPYVPNAPNRALLYGNAAHTGKIPAAWLAKDAADAVVVICAGESRYGTPVQTCPYESEIGIYGYTDVTFKKIAIPLRVFEVRTGKLVADFTVQIGGASCPAVLEYTSYSYVDFGPPSEVYVTASVNDVRAAFRPLLVK